MPSNITTTLPQCGQLLAGNRFAERKATKLSSAWAGRHEEVLKAHFANCRCNTNRLSSKPRRALAHPNRSGEANVPLSPTGAELLFEVFSQRYKRGSIMVTTNLPFDEWTEVLGSERLTGALLDRLTHHVHILEMNGESYRLERSRETAASQAPDDREEE